MNKVTTLPIDLGQSPELKGDNTISIQESKQRGDDFSQVLSQNGTNKSHGNKVAKLTAENTTTQENLEKPIARRASEENNLLVSDGEFKDSSDTQATDQVVDNTQTSVNEDSSDDEATRESTQTEQLLQILQNADKALVDKESKNIIATYSDRVTQEDGDYLSQTLTDTELEQLQANQENKSTVNISEGVFQQAKMLTPKISEPVDPNLGKNWKGGIELPVEPPVMVENIEQSLATELTAEQKQVLDEQALILKQILPAQEKISSENSVISTKSEDKAASSNSGLNKTNLEKIAAMLEDRVNSEGGTNKNKQDEASKVDNITNLNPFAFTQKSNITEEKKSLNETTAELIATVKNDDNDFVEDMGIEQLTQKAVNHTGNMSKVEQQIYSTLTGQTNNSINSYSDGQLQDIQSLQAISDKVIESNHQNQKVELAKQAETIAIYKKDFVNNLQDKVMVMVHQKLQQVDIRLDPPELGQMQVKLHLNNDQANVQFVVQNQQAKDALDQNMPKLREMLADQGINVGDANVGQQGDKGFMAEKGQEANHILDNVDEDDYFDASQAFTDKVVKGSATGIDYYA